MQITHTFNNYTKFHCKNGRMYVTTYLTINTITNVFLLYYLTNTTQLKLSVLFCDITQKETLKTKDILFSSVTAKCNNLSGMF